MSETVLPHRDSQQAQEAALSSFAREALGADRVVYVKGFEEGVQWARGLTVQSPDDACSKRCGNWDGPAYHTPECPKNATPQSQDDRLAKWEPIVQRAFDISTQRVDSEFCPSLSAQRVAKFILGDGEPTIQANRDVTDEAICRFAEAIGGDVIREHDVMMVSFGLGASFEMIREGIKAALNG